MLFTIPRVFAIVDDILFVAFWVHEECREAFNIETLSFIFGAVHLCNDKVLNALDVLCDLFPDRCQLFAVAAPRRINFDEDVL